MKILLNILFIILSVTLNTQKTKEIEILNADNTFANEKKHPNYWRLIGNICFKHNNTIMHCDSAYHYINENKIKAFGNIKITQGDSIKLTGNTLTYFGIKNKAKIKGNVVFIDKYMTLKTQQISYDLNSNVASYPFFGEIIDNEKNISSQKGKYYANNHTFIFTDSVKVLAKDYNIITQNMHYNSNNEITYFFGPSYIISKNEKIYCENGWHNTKTHISQFQKNAYITTKNYLLKGDSIYYNKNIGYAKAIKNVELIDTTQKITIFGGVGEYFEDKEIAEITQIPFLQILTEDDTLFMHANKFLSYQKNNNHKITAYNKVKFFKTDLQGKCDSLSYNVTDSTIKMFSSPILWSNEFQITSDSIEFIIKKGKIHRLFLKSMPMIIKAEDSLDYNQIKGKEITAYFTNNKINKMNIKGNGESIFIVVDEKTNKKIGLNYTECTNLTLYFKNNKINMVNYKIKPKSITTPYANVEEKNRYLKGFKYRGVEQPKTKKDIFIQ
ncbi:MAG: OstA-like protein [Bacteroidota bacterium]|nr:OstA-like protein [Bacteroidota bacterium]